MKRLALLAFVPAMALGATRVGPEVQISRPVLGAPAAVVRHAAATLGPTHYLLTSTDTTVNGTLLDEAAKPIPTSYLELGPGAVEDLIAARGGYYAMWRTLAGIDLNIRRIEADGRLGTEAYSTTIPTFSTQITSTLTWNGSKFLALFATQSSRELFTVEGIILDAALRPERRFVVSSSVPGAIAASRLSCAPGPELFACVWNTAESIAGAIVFNNGDVTPMDVPVGGPADEVVIATNGFHYVMAWRRNNEVYSLFYDTRLRPADQIVLVHRVNGGTVASLDLVYAGIDYMVGYGVITANDRVFVVRPLSAAFGEEVGNKHIGRLASDGTNLLATWQEQVVTAKRLLPQRGDEQVVSLRPESQGQPAIATDRSRSVVVWIENGRVRAARVGEDGQPAAAINLTEGTNAAEPAIAFGGVDFLVAWKAGQEVLGRFLDGDGNPRGPAFSIGVAANSSEIDSLAVGATTTDFVVAWSGLAGAVARVTPTGVVTRIRDLSNSFSGISISTDRAPLVVWSARLSATSTVIRGAFVESVNTTYELGSATATPGAAFSVYTRDPKADCSATDCLVAWTRDNTSPQGSEALLTGLTRAGSISFRTTPIQLHNALAEPVQTEVLFDGYRYRLYTNGSAMVIEHQFHPGSLDPAVSTTLPMSGLGISSAVRDLEAAALSSRKRLIVYARGTAATTTAAGATGVYVRVVEDDTPARRRIVRR